MLASLHHQHPLSAPHDYLPAIPSPLSPRSANIYGRRLTILMSSPSSDAESVKSHATTNSSSRNVAFSKRPVKKAPSPKQDEIKDQRRSLFLKKVRDEREDKRFEARGEDVMRLDFVQRRREWEARLASEAAMMATLDPPEDENGQEANDDVYDLPSSSNVMQISAPSTQQQPTFSFGDEVEAEEVAQREQDELDWLVASYMQPDTDDERVADDVYDRDDGDQSQHLYSDDDDYDALFAEIVQQENVAPGVGDNVNNGDDGEAMDIS